MKLASKFVEKNSLYSFTSSYSPNKTKFITLGANFLTIPTYSMTITWQQRFYYLGIYGAIQFLLLTFLAMQVYPGGTLHEPHLEKYSFLYNFFSDLGRTQTFDGHSNSTTHLIFKTTLTLGGISLILFFMALPSLFKQPISKGCSFLAMLFGIISGISYIGIGHLPWDMNYWEHRFYVRVGFVAFLTMTFFYTLAILIETKYPNRYAMAMGVFALVLAIQIAIMFYATNAWHSNEALYLQAVAQKVVVYAEILCMLYQSYGALKVSQFAQI